MDQPTTYFSFCCAACGGRARVASHHAGQAIVCPYCQVNGIARPDMQPSVVPRAPSQQRVDAQGNPATTTRVARPLGAPITTSVRRPQPTNGSSTQQFDTQELFADERASSPRAAAPGMAGFADDRPASGTAAVRRPQPGTATIARAQAPVQPGTATIARGQAVKQASTATLSRTAPGRPAAVPTPSNAPFFVVAAAAAMFALLTTWAAVDANTYRSRYQQARDQADKATAQLADIQATADTLDKRLAKTQFELAAAQASITRERELVANLQKTVGRLGEDLAKASLVEMPGISRVPTASAVSSLTSGSAFPSAVLPMAGFPVARRENTTAPTTVTK